MPDYHPNIHHRKSIRLKGYDYSKTGWYFITTCVQNRECLFGEIRAATIGAQDAHVGAPLRGRPDTNPPQMILTAAGEMIAKWYYELENKYPGIRCREMVVMPNHFHCIIEIMDDHQQDAHVGAPLRGRPVDTCTIDIPQYGPDNKKFGVPMGEMVDWFKTMTTNEYIRGVKNQGWKRFDGKLWQRNYWEHIIRDDGSYSRIAAYILQNPSKWKDDQLNPHNRQDDIRHSALYHYGENEERGGLRNKKGITSKTMIFYKLTSPPRQENPFGSILGSIIERFDGVIEWDNF